MDPSARPPVLVGVSGAVGVAGVVGVRLGPLPRHHPLGVVILKGRVQAT